MLCAGAVHVCVVALASPMLALRAPAMYMLAVHAFVIARLRFPCSRCVHLLCVPLFCVPALCPLVWCVVCLCSAQLHRAALVDVTDTTPFVDPGDLTCPPDDRPDTYSPCLCSFLDPLQRTDPLDFDKQCCPRGRFDHLIGMTQKIWLSILNFYKFTQAPGKHTRSRSPLPSPRHQTRCALYPLPPHSLHAHPVMYALMPNHWSHSLDSGSFT